MKQLDEVVAKDPLKLKKYDVGNGQKQSKMIYIFLLAIPVLLTISLVFYVFGNLTDTSATQEQRYPPTKTRVVGGEEEDNENEEGSTPQGELFQDRTKIADSMPKIQVGLRIMPSHNDENGIILMHWTNESTAYESELGHKVDAGDNYFFYGKTQDYFPVMRFNPDYVPFGDAPSFCINLQWIKKDMRKIYDMYKTVQGFPNCTNAMNSKFRWQVDDPKTGVDFKVWNQDKVNVASESECDSKGGIYRAFTKGDGGRCYSYTVLKRICLMIAYTEHPETASYTWEYRGGCYSGGNIAIYEKAQSGEDYKFDDVPIEVREDESLYVAFGNLEAQAESTLSPIFFFLSTIALFLALVSGVLFAYYFFQAWKGAQMGDRMRHQQYVDEQ